MYNNPYYNPMQTYMPNQNMYKPLEQPIQQTTQSTYMQPIQYNKPSILQGKVVDSIETVKSQEIPLDGSTSYFALADGSSIITKQLMQDGTSKTTIYKPIVEEDKKEEKEEIKYITIEDLEKSLKNIDLSKIDDLKDEIKELRQEIKKKKKED